MRTYRLAAAVAMVWCLPALAADNELTKQEKKDGWILLFDGKTLDGWMTIRETPSRTPPQNGTLNPRRCGGYLLVTKKTWGDFILSLDFKISEGGNSGVFVRQFPLKPPKGLDIPACGIEVQILDAPTATYYDTGGFYDLVMPSKNTMRAQGEWNTMVIACDDNIMTASVNGEVVSRMDLDQFTEPYRRPDGTEHKFPVAWSGHSRKGYIGLQDHGDDVWFKNLKLLPLNKKTRKRLEATGDLPL